MNCAPTATRILAPPSHTARMRTPVYRAATVTCLLRHRIPLQRADYLATGHTFVVGSEACINCHKDTVHTRDTIVALSGQQTGEARTTEELEKLVSEKEDAIQNLEAQSSVRLYTGLIQGSIVGLIIGGVAAWVVSQRIRFVEVEENDDTEKED
jgi:hypothetical protein